MIPYRNACNSSKRFFSLVDLDLSSRQLSIVVLFSLLLGWQALTVQGQAKAAKIVINNPTVTAGTTILATGNVVFIEFTVRDPAVTFVKFKITSDQNDAGGFLMPVTSGKANYSRYVPLFRGKNQIELFAVQGDGTEKASAAKLPVICNDPSCFSALPPTTLVGPGGDENSKNVNISRPAGGEAVTDMTTIERTIAVQKASGIKNLVVDVTNGSDIIDHRLWAVEDLPGLTGFAKVKIKLAQGPNKIVAYSLDTLGEKGNQDSIQVSLTCSDAKCGKTDADTGASKSHVTVLQPTNPFDAGNKAAIDAYVSVAKESAIPKLQYEIFQSGKLVDPGDAIDVPAHAGKAAILQPRIQLRQGDNIIRFFDPSNPANGDEQASLKVTCNGNKCLAAGAKAAEAKNITIDEPNVVEGQTYQATDQSSLLSYVKVAQGSGITRIQYDVIHNGKVEFTSDPQIVDVSGKANPVTLRFLKGQNTIRIYDADHPGGDDDASIGINCTGPKCAPDFLFSTIPTNSRIMRAIVGMEQAGASSAESKTAPFLDFFFNTPFHRHTNENELSRLGTWGQVRLSTTPDQTSSFAVFPSNFVNQVTDPTKVVDLVQSFDFLAGLEYRATSSKLFIPSLIPGVKQKGSLYFTFGGGAISPLSVKRESAQLFMVPPDPDPRRAVFIERFGNPGSLKYVGFVPLERDRFFRQYYIGVRAKTYFYDENDKLLRRFPAIVDFAVGQNEAVTGGRLKSEVRDSVGNLVGHRRAWVARVDAFFPLPFREASFLYLYGTAMMQISSGPKIQTPLFLDVPASTVQITDPSVFVPSADRQPTKIDRDYYKIGIGVNLTDLFNRNKTPPN